MPAQLVALNDGPSILVDKPILLLGRHPECDIQIDSRKISRRHCCIAQVEDYLVVRDLDSTNGIRINGVRVVEGRLKEGDELMIGNQRYQVSWDSVPAAPLPAVPRKAAPPAVPLDDELLESCDEPVALPEPGSRH
jgi:pSer/pThr/pTyr-binding forkhead associated (FHA) protein